VVCTIPSRRGLVFQCVPEKENSLVAPRLETGRYETRYSITKRPAMFHVGIGLALGPDHFPPRRRVVSECAMNRRRRAPRIPVFSASRSRSGTIPVTVSSPQVEVGFRHPSPTEPEVFFQSFFCAISISDWLDTYQPACRGNHSLVSSVKLVPGLVTRSKEASRGSVLEVG